ncbi:hypothetical protein [Thioalkalivibrio sp. ALJ2]|uniref:hypothetical protein n=1 Tax=Thioalkalivibrio sp. ALJ2 TaxID=1261622 RepID=UPI000379094F|nr:hypothetical protein [Thioalkalivibrio sp. ALJ2]
MMLGTITRTLLAGAAIAALSGCIVIEETRPTTSSSSTAGSNSQASGQQQYANEILNFEVTTATDVDTAFNRIRRQFGYLPLEQRTNPAGQPWLEASDAYHFRENPGSFYSLRDYREILGYAGVVQMDISRDGNGSHIAVEYYEGTDRVEGFPATDEFMDRFRAKVRSTVE